MNLRRLALELSQNADAVDVGHQEIQQHDVHRQPVHEIEHGRTVLAFADDLEAVLLIQHEPEALADKLVVVDDEDAGHPASTGNDTVTLVPCPSEVATSSVPPTASTRCCIMRMPLPSSPPVLSNPTPSSSMPSSTNRSASLSPTH